MTEEIKEILYDLKPKYDIVDELGNDYKKVKFKDCKLLLDYITNLQQEKDCLQRNYDDNEQAIQKLIKELKELQQEMNYYKKQYQNYKSRIDKALKYFGKCDWNDKHCFENLINILLGSDENE